MFQCLAIPSHLYLKGKGQEVHYRVSGLEGERFIGLCLAACFRELGAPIKAALRHIRNV